MVTFTRDILRWHLFSSPERLQVLLCILLHADEAGIVDPLIMSKLPLLTELSSATISRSLDDLSTDGIIDVGVDASSGAYGIRLLRLPDGLSLPTTVPQHVTVPSSSAAGSQPATVSSSSAAGSQPAPAPSCLQEGSTPSRKRRTSAPFRKPTVDEVAAFIREQGYSLDPQRFFDYEETVGWVVGKTRKPMKDWRAAIRYQERTNHKPSTLNHKPLSSYEQQRQSSRDLYLASEACGSLQRTDIRTSLADDRTLAAALDFLPADGID